VNVDDIVLVKNIQSVSDFSKVTIAKKRDLMKVVGKSRKRIVIVVVFVLVKVGKKLNFVFVKQNGRE
jgi:hypothetical protein